MSGAEASLLPDGKRLHLHHGPIDLILEVFGTERGPAYACAVKRFQGLLEGLVEELPSLRRPLDGRVFADPVARRMARAVAPFEGFVTPMAAVAGAVADEILDVLLQCRPAKAYVNNGGDIAFYLAPGEGLTVQGASGPIHIRAEDRARGLATSGWRGRSLSLGIADAVSVAAGTAAGADAAATLIANAVDLPGHPGIRRVPASEISPESDLGARLVTTAVGPLSDQDCQMALAQGAAVAERFRARGLIEQAQLSLAGRRRIVAPREEIPAHA